MFRALRLAGPVRMAIRSYRLTRKGVELVDLLMVMTAWGDKWLAGEAGPPVLYRHHACGEITSVDLRCGHCGEPLHATDVDTLSGSC